MMVYKLLGAVLLFISAILCACVLVRGYELEIRTIEAYIELMRYIRTEVDIYAMPIDEILKRCSGELIALCGGDESSPPRDLQELFSGADIKDKAAHKELCEFCSDFGRNYREEQIKRCDASIDVLEARRGILIGELQNKKRLCYTLSLSAASAIVILLI